MLNTIILHKQQLFNENNVFRKYYYVHELIGNTYRLLEIIFKANTVELHHTEIVAFHSEIPGNTWCILMVFGSFSDMNIFFASFGLTVTTEHLIDVKETKKLIDMLNTKKSLLK